jgi:hypothetical protein
MVDVGATRIELDRALFKGAASPDPASADLYEFLTTRLQDALGLLGCDPGRN